MSTPENFSASLPVDLPDDWQDMEMFGFDVANSDDRKEWERTRPTSQNTSDHNYDQDIFEFGGPYTPEQNKEN